MVFELLDPSKPARGSPRGQKCYLVYGFLRYWRILIVMHALRQAVTKVPLDSLCTPQGHDNLVDVLVPGARLRIHLIVRQRKQCSKWKTLPRQTSQGKCLWQGPARPFHRPGSREFIGCRLEKTLANPSAPDIISVDAHDTNKSNSRSLR